MATSKENKVPDTKQQNLQQNQALNQLVERFKALPRPIQIVLGVAVFFIVFSLISGGRDNTVQQRGQEPVGVTNAVPERQNQEVFSGLNTDTPELMKGWFNQSQQDLASMKDQLESKMVEQDESISRAVSQNEQLQQEMRQILDDFKAELLNLQDNEKRDREILGQLAEETRKLQLNSPASVQVNTVSPQRQKKRISQTPLGNPASLELSGDQSLLGGVVNTGESIAEGEDPYGSDEDEEKRPFIPPLGFIKATLLNGVDALVGGSATPALARLHGSYKTAHSGTVMLDGCFLLLEFNGEISTERAIGKPSRMTCVYPDQGVATYGVSGYVVDEADGIIGVPGVFYEGDATRLAAAMVADFAAGMADIIEQNQNTFTADSSGNAQKLLTGDEVKAEIAGGVGSAVSSLRDYLFERANRVLPFVRIDATRTLHVVLLSGVELRSQGNPWTLLYAADE
ncbi:MAG: hypothetical protein OXR68_06675 [Alphaproteobacteria bacterium]|nr:hypothetical protein [Alphaproteobacteria bacterium]MDD9920288.1 hypothetical protein [Alphaproteobacteria bacterium]